MSERYGKLSLVEVLPERTADKHVVGLWKCDCGNETRVAMSRVRHGYTRSCGCLVGENSPRKHGMRYSPEYSSWQSMKARCLDSGNKDYPRWGGRGVTVCDEWVNSFENFFAHIGSRPPGTSLDRIDGSKGYEPGNVRWATPRVQARNRRGAFRWHIKGKTFESHSEAAVHFQVSDYTVWRWVNGQMDKRRGTFTPPREDCHVEPRY